MSRQRDPKLTMPITTPSVNSSNTPIRRQIVLAWCCHAYNPSTLKAEAGGCPELKASLELHSETQLKKNPKYTTVKYYHNGVLKTPKFLYKPYTLGLAKLFSGRRSFCAVLRPEFNPWALQDGRRQPTRSWFSLTATDMHGTYSDGME